MKIFLTSILLIILSSCSFDNKTGIWQNSNESNLKKDQRRIRLEKLSKINLNKRKIFLKKIKKNNK